MSINPKNQKLLDDYAYMLNVQVRKNQKRKNTVTAYISDLNQFFDYLCEIDATKIEFKHANEWLESLRGRNGESINASTENRKIISLKQFYKYLRDSNIMELDPLVMLKPTTIEIGEDGNQESKEFLEKTEIIRFKKVLEHEANNPEYKKGVVKANVKMNALRDRAMFMLMLATGLRVGEVINLELHEIVDTGDGMSVYVPKEKSKNKMSRYVPIDDDIHDMINMYRNNLIYSPDNNYVFLSQNLNKMDSNNIQRRLDYYMEKANIKKHISNHSLRHTYATHMAAYTDKLDLAYFMGHKSTAMIERVYYHMTNEAKRKTFKF